MTSHCSPVRFVIVALLLQSLFLASCLAAPFQIHYQEGFESDRAVDDWEVEGGTWQIGAISSGPLFAFAGQKGAGTILGGNYNEGARARLISPRITLPAANLNPRLRLWQWFEFGDDADFGELHLRIVGGTWEKLTTLATRNGNGIWSRPSVDLSAFGGRAVQLGFWFQSDGTIWGSAVGPGWYIDELVVESGSEPFDGNEGFESGQGSWYVEGGVWQVGVPTTGPAINTSGNRAYSGTNCAATVLSGNYNEGMRSRLISPRFEVPALSSIPRLRFWHWFEFGDGADFGEVHIREGTNAWRKLSTVAAGNSNGNWSRPSIDLSEFAGKRVEISFWFQSDGTVWGSAVGPGWYIDDLEIVTGEQALYNPEGFELGLADWSVEGGVWQVGTPTGGPSANGAGDRAYAGKNCAATVLNGNYYEGMRSRLVGPPFKVPHVKTKPRLRFWHWFEFADGADFGQFQVREGNGEWKVIGSNYTGNSGGVWSRPSIDLSAYAGKTIQFSFWFQSDGTVWGPAVGAGWYIDDIRLLHDFSLEVQESPTIRTGITVNVSLAIAASSPTASLAFTVPASSEQLNGVAFVSSSCWSGEITALPDSQYRITLQNNCETTLFGQQTIGTLRFSPISAQSSFLFLVPDELLVSNRDGSEPEIFSLGSRPAIVASDLLMDANLGPGRDPRLTVYGPPNTKFRVLQSHSIAGAPASWERMLTNTIPADMSYSASSPGNLSQDPIIFLRAEQQ